MCGTWNVNHSWVNHSWEAVQCDSIKGPHLTNSQATRMGVLAEVGFARPRHPEEFRAAHLRQNSLPITSVLFVFPTGWAYGAGLNGQR